VFGGETAHFLLGFGPQIAKAGALKKMGPFGYSRNVIRDLRGRFLDPLDLLHGESAQVHWAGALPEERHGVPPKLWIGWWFDKLTTNVLEFTTNVLELTTNVL